MTAGNMTTPAQFRQNVLKVRLYRKLKNLKKYQSIKSKEKNSEKPIFQALDYMEEHLAPGSHVVLVGLIDAGFLYKVHAMLGFLSVLWTNRGITRQIGQIPLTPTGWPTWPSTML